MLQLSKIFKIGLIGLLLLLLMPYVFIFKYTVLSGDDFTRAVYNFSDYFENYSNWFYYHNGRFINGLISLLPIYTPTILKVVLLCNFCLTPVVFYFFLKRLFHFINLKVKFDSLLLTSLSLFCLSLIQMPLIVENYYWLSAMTVYSLSFSSFLMFCYFKFNVLLGKGKSLIGAGFFLVIAIGSNEIFILLINSIVFFILSYQFLRFKKINRKLVFVQILSIIASLVIILGPGSTSRQSNFEDGGDLTGAGLLSLKNTVSIIVNQFSNLEDLIVVVTMFSISFLILASGSKVKKTNSLHPLILGVASFILVFVIIFTPNYAMGGISYNEGRLGNLIQVLLLFIFFINILNLTMYIQPRINFLSTSNSILPTVILGVVLTISVVSSVNFKGLYNDFSERLFQKQQKSYDDRLTLIKNTTSKNLILVTQIKSYTLNYEEITNDPDHWYNRSYVNFVNKKYGLSIKSITIVE